MKTCNTCRHWSLVNESGQLSRCYHADWQGTYGVHGICRAFAGREGDSDAAHATDSSNGEYGYAEIITGPAFGCIHHAPIEQRATADSLPQNPR